MDPCDTARSARRSRGGPSGVALLIALLAASCGGEVPGPSTAEESLSQPAEVGTGLGAEAAQVAEPAEPAAPVVEAFPAHEPRAAVDERAIAESRGFRAESLAFDWGDVAKGEVVQHRFVLRNDTQNHVLLVEPRRLAKGVTVDFDRAIEPFSEGRVDVRLDTAVLAAGDAMIRVPLIGNVVNAPTLVLRGHIRVPVAAADERE
jgi:hypothetical protein